MSLARFGVLNPVPVNLLMVALLVAGIYSGLTMTREFFPDTSPESAIVSFVYPGATPEEIEESLVRKIEDAIFDLDEVEQIRTSVAEGGGTITVEFRDGIRSVSRATDEVERAIDALTDIPTEVERITVTEFEPVLPVIQVSVYGMADEASLKQAIRDIRDDLEGLPNMGDMVESGVRAYEVRVDVNADILQRHGISLPEVADSVGGWLRDVPGGTVRTDAGNVNVRTRGVTETAEAIREIPVGGTPDGQILRVDDVAQVSENFVDQQIKTRFTTREATGPAANLTVYKVGNQDAVRIAEMVRAYVAGRREAAGLTSDPGWSLGDRVAALDDDGRDAMQTVRQRAWLLGRDHPNPLPAGTSIDTSSDLARFIEGRLDLLLRNAAAGGVLVFATLLLFLNWRTALWVGVGLATALAGTLLFMKTIDVTLNLLTMFGLIVVMGLLVDDAIVVAENIQARHDKREPALEAAIRGTEQVLWPVVATVLTSIVAFSPLTFIEGQIGDLLDALPLVVLCALSMSLLESILILPGHMGHALAARDRSTPGPIGRALARFEAARDRIIMGKIIPGFGRVLRLAIRWRYFSISIASAAFIASAGMVAGGRVPFVFLPTSDSETIIAELRMPIGTPIEETERIVEQIEQAAMAQPETRSINTLLGVVASVDDTSGITNAGQGTHLGQLFVELVPVEIRQAAGQRESSQVIQAIRDAVGPIDGAEAFSFKEIQGGPAGADITVQVTGNDTELVDQVVERIKDELASLEGVFDIADDDAAGQREVKIDLRPGAAALGYRVVDVARQVRGALFGLDAHVFSRDREDIDVRIRLDESSRQSLPAIESLWVKGPRGSFVPLGEIADLQEGDSYNAIRRVDRERAVSVTAATAPGVSPEDIAPALEPTFAALRAEFPEVGIDTAGRQRQMRKAFASLPVGFAAACVMIYLILAWLFASYTQPIAVMLAIPFATIGVIWGHLLMGYEMTFLSLIGFVALSGIVVNDSLILVQFYNGRRAAGDDVHAALEFAGRQRLRPIFLTTVTTVLGLTPLMLEQSFQAKFLIPMAVSIAFGLISATFLILLVLPCILVVLEDVRAAVRWGWTGGAAAKADPPVLPTVED
ncbi:MAG: efflux RND transporter permease subunit [Phycisphaerales bacterium]